MDLRKKLPKGVIELALAKWVATDGAFTCMERNFTNVNGCQDTTTLELKINAGVQNTLTAVPLEGCEPLSVTFDLVNAFNADLDSLYQIEFFPGDGSSTILTMVQNQQFTHVYSRFGTYVPYVITRMFSGCSDTAYTPSVEVYLTPNADFTYTLLNYRTLAFQNTSSDLDTSSTYLWSFGDGTTYNLNAPLPYSPKHS